MTTTDERKQRIAFLAEHFPEAAARDPRPSPILGGRRAAEAALAAIDPARYGRTRSRLDGAVTRLSPYLRHGVLTLAEVRDAALRGRAKRGEAWKLINELSWRDYFVRVYEALGDELWHDLEPPKTGLPPDAYRDEVPDDLRAGSTGARCIDTWSQSLAETGYLHNHARMWLAAYVVHWRRVRWQAGAAWWLEHLLDGDPASNNLSWQWVASTWRRYPYIWNRANLLKNGGRALCDQCPLLDNGCPFQASYKTLAERLFPAQAPHPAQPARALARERLREVPIVSPLPEPPRHSSGVVVWIHGDGLNPKGPALHAYPDAPAVWVWDDALLASYRITLKRLLFLYECLLELPVTLRRGDVAQQVATFAAAAGARTVATTPSPSPRFRAIVAQLRERFEVQIWPDAPFARKEGSVDLTRHAAYWQSIKGSALRMTTEREP